MRVNVETGLKICSSCRIEQEVGNFNKSKSRPDGYDNKCRKCANAYTLKFYYDNHERELEQRRKYREAHRKQIDHHRASIREQLKEVNRKYREEHPEEIAAAKKAWYEKNRDKNKDLYMQRTYGISMEDFWRVWKEQGEKCPGCGKQLTYRKGGYAIDHDHNTNKFRWILCPNCNFILGHSNDNPATLKTLANLLDSIK